MTTIKEQAIEALKHDPFAKTFVSTKQCVKDGCGCFVRRTSGNFSCLNCCNKRNKAWHAKNKDKAKKDFAAWYEKHKDYCNKKDRANYLKRKEARANESV